MLKYVALLKITPLQRCTKILYAKQNSTNVCEYASKARALLPLMNEPTKAIFKDHTTTEMHKCAMI